MKISLNMQIFAGALLGIVFGIILGHTNLSPDQCRPYLAALDCIGKIFISLLKLLMVPLVFTSITAGIANLKNYPKAGRMWPTLIAYSLTTTALAAATGLTVMNLIKPGVGLNLNLFADQMKNYKAQAVTPADLGHRLIHDVFLHPLTAISQFNILTIVFLALLVGLIIIFTGKRSDGALKFINKAFEWMMHIVRLIMYLAPLGVMGLLAVLVARQNVQLLTILGKYIFVVMATTLFQGAITLPLILWSVTKISPLKFWQAMKEALITAFSTSSSTATLPVSLRCITEKLGIDAPIARFVLPVGSVLNMDGTAMYEAMAALFVANLCGVHLSLAGQIAVALTAMTASIGAPGIPSAGMVTMIMVLQAAGLPAQAVAILIPIDRPLDTLRTMVNVEGDCVGACVVQHVTKGL